MIRRKDGNDHGHVQFVHAIIYITEEENNVQMLSTNI
jgi:hypothetical protein